MKLERWSGARPGGVLKTLGKKLQFIPGAMGSLEGYFRGVVLSDLYITRLYQH